MFDLRALCRGIATKFVLFRDDDNRHMLLCVLLKAGCSSVFLCFVNCQDAYACIF
jgi:hypothetical protein